MANPATTVRLAPVGRLLKDGHPTKVAFARDPDISLWELTVKPPGVSGGDPINITTMHNVIWETKASQALQALTDGSLTFAYDPVVYNQILGLVNQEGSVTVRYSDGSTLDFFGYLGMFDPNEISRGTMPTASGTLVTTNLDPVNEVEAGPVLTSVAGT